MKLSIYIHQQRAEGLEIFSLHNQKYKSFVLKIKSLINHNKNYYEKNAPLITDEEYDQLKISLIKLEKKYEFLKSKNSPLPNSEQVGVDGNSEDPYQPL